MPDTTQGTSSEARLLVDEQFLRRVAYMYYEEGHSQETIADIESCSRQTVSKALQKAKDRGIVHISIVPDLRTGFLRNLAREARQRLNLEDVVLVPGDSFVNVRADATLDEVVAEITKAQGFRYSRCLWRQNVHA
jgi:deoxyribonucleoside regulator